MMSDLTRELSWLAAVGGNAEPVLSAAAPWRPSGRRPIWKQLHISQGL